MMGKALTGELSCPVTGLVFFFFLQIASLLLVRLRIHDKVSVAKKNQKT